MTEKSLFPFLPGQALTCPTWNKPWSSASGAVSTDENDVIITNVRHFEALE